MATRTVLAELASDWRARSGVDVAFESVGGVDAAKRVQAGESYDLAVLDADALEKLVATGRVVPDSQAALVRSGVAITVRAGAPHPDVSSEEALKRAMLAARSIGHSTGPSGTALLRLFERWGLLDALRPRIVQAPPGVPVGKLVADGQVELGFQQYSEMMNVPGIDVLGPMPPGCGIVSTFSAGLCAASTQPEAVRDLIDFMHSPAADDAKRRHGMEPA
ncbi:MAG: molybdenum ABC transporter substrate-binding protein [Rhodocyclales bacterium]|nr:MAG: molybdenum ABC transporter substrate-binding protein [Rhodocyclales bacterium]